MLLICVTGDIIHGINKLGRRRKSSTPESHQSRASYGSVSQPSYHSSDYTGYYDQAESERVRALRIAFWFLAMSQILLLISLCLGINENAESLSKLVAEREEIEKETMHLEDERQTLERERLFLKEERKRWERAREGLRVPHGAFWEVVWPKWECLSYGRREYWGILGNIPEDRTDIDACMNMPVEIKGVTIKRPSRCQFLGDSPHVHGFWMVDWDQPDCKPWHEDFIDRVSSGQSQWSHLRTPVGSQALISRAARTQGLAPDVSKPPS